jgi:serine/threonine protein kinase
MASLPHEPAENHGKESGVSGINQDIARQLQSATLVPPSILQDYLAKCSQNKQHLGQSLVKDGYLTVQQLAKILALVKTKEKSTESAAHPVAPQQGLAGEILGEHVILAELGRGGMGVVYQARHQTTGQTVALKVLLGGSQADSGQVRRFLREAESIANLHHDNIIPIYTISQDKGYHYFTMPYLTGGSFEHLLNKTDTSFAVKIEILCKIARALSHAHGKRIVHRDLKPANILLDQNGEPFLTDFGLAKNLDSNSRLTQTGNVVGTPFYMSPEQIKAAKKLDHRSDIYSLGIILYQILTGQLPFVADTPIELYCKIAEQEPPAPKSLNSAVSGPLAAICLKAIEKSPDFRYQNAETLAEDLERFLHGEKVIAQKLDVRRYFSAALRRHHLHLLWASLLVILPMLALAVVDYQARSRHKSPPPEPQAEIAKRYEDGVGKMNEQRPEEAYIYFNKALQFLLLEKKKTKQGAPHSKLDEMEKRLYLAIADAAYQAANYQEAYRVGELSLQYFSLSSATARKVRWQMACAAYHCQIFGKAEALFVRLEQELTASDNSATVSPLSGEDILLYISSIYHQGSMSFANGLWKSVRQKMERAIEIYQAKQCRYDFGPAMYLYYCASALADFEAPPTPQELTLIAGYLNTIPADLSADMGNLYRETKARYLLYVAQSAADGQKEQAAREVLSLVESCLQQRLRKGSLYYMRGRAYQFLQEYTRAKNDFISAMLRDPANLSYLRAQLELLAEYAEPSDFHNYYVDFHRDSEKVLWAKVNLFAKEFALLKGYYIPQSLSMAKGIPFSEQKFAEFYHLLQDESLRQIGEAALCSMFPWQKTTGALDEKLRQMTTPSDGQTLQKLIVAIREADQQRQMIKLLATLSQLADEDKIWDLDHFNTPEQLNLLQNLINDSRCDVLMRFLAARVLVRMPSLAVRQQLVEQYQKQDISLRIIIARALQEVEIVHTFWNKNFFAELSVFFTPQQTGLSFSGDNTEDRIVTAEEEKEFLYFSLAEILPCYEPKAIQIAQWLLENGSQRVKLAVLSRCNMIPTQLRPLLAEVCRQGVFSTQQEMRTYTIAILGRHLNYSLDTMQSLWRGFFRQELWNDTLHKHICGLAQQDNLPMQKAILYLWRGLARVIKHYPGEKQDIIKVVRTMWKSTDSLIRCQAMASSAQMNDQELLPNLLDKKTSFSISEQITGLLVSFKIQYRQNKQHLAKFIQHCLKTIKDPEVAPLLRGIMLYMCTLYMNASQEQSPIQPMMLMPLLEVPLLDGLRSPWPILRFASILAVGNMSRVSLKMLAVLGKIKDDDTCLHIRAAASGVLLAHYRNNSLPEYNALKTWIEQQQGETARMYKLAALWGYTSYLTNSHLISYKINSQLGSEPEKIWSYRCQRMLQYLEQNPGELQEYIKRLESVMELKLEDEILQTSQEYFYLLVWFYQISGQTEKALPLASSTVNRLGRKNIRLTELWAQLMVKNNQSPQVKAKLEQMLQEASQPVPDEDMNRLAIHQASLYRSLAQVCQQGAEYSYDIELLLKNQYLLAPQQTFSLRAMLEYYYLREDYQQVIFLCQEVAFYLPNDGEPYIWLAKAYARLGDHDKGLSSLDIACDYGYFHTPQHLKMHPEFAVWADRAEYKKIVEDNFSSKNKKND